MEAEKTLETSQPNDNNEVTFDEAYVKKLREENASRRIREKELETKLNELETKAKEEQGKYKELYEKKTSEYEELLTKYSTYEVIVNELNERTEKERMSLLKSLPKEYQNLYENATKEQIEVFLKHIKTETEGEAKPPVSQTEPKTLADLAKHLYNNKRK